MARWKKTAKWKRARVALIGKRDGSLCWLCNRSLLKIGEAKNRKITLEHLTPRALGGTDDCDNLVLCHPACNRHLADRPVQKKHEIRAKWHRETARTN